ncbi:hypothetical protein BP5796_12918 [Coleophoma crateriformis]|uniref:DUF6594 domain-containing protein n=1 Tax=Coleophoma crateriformis TaxID=565419 RepID=A0A3D8Q4U9_9HELO|nr:hypothetical protein BP5796_12918 [Coleophoma crateriformis]
MASLINNEASSSQNTPIVPLPEDNRRQLICNPNSYNKTLAQKSKSNRSLVARDVGDIHIGVPNIARFLDNDENFMLYRRFVILHAFILSLNREERQLLEAELYNMDEEESIGMRQMARSESQKRSEMLRKFEFKLAEYSDFILPANNSGADIDLTSAGSQSVEHWLCQGPDLEKLDQESNPRWKSYTAEVKRVVLDPQASDWLHYSIEDLLNVREHGTAYHVSNTSLDRGRQARGSINRDQRSTYSRPRETADQHNALAALSTWILRANQALQWLFGVLFLPISILIHSVNISSALGYLMLVNTSISQQNGSSDIYWKITLIAWGVTITFLLVHGLFFGVYKTDCYVRRLVLTCIVFCGAIALALHALGANVMSGILVGFTLSVIFLQIW